MEPRFSFGRNWLNYAKSAVDETVISEAAQSLLRFLPRKEIEGKIFVDAGCGSGIFSLAALRLGAGKALGFDLDPQSLEASEYVREKFGGEQAARWEIFSGDVLDPEFIASGRARGDMVYSWGVLHHTGQMRQAVKNALSLVNPGGFFALAIYNRTPASPFWTRAKRFYNYHPLLRPALELGWGAMACAAYMARRGTLSLRRERGMHVFYDAVDWIGGWPFECASFDEVREFVESHGAKLEKEVTRLYSKPAGKASFLDRFHPFDTGCNEFLFKKT